MFQLLFDRARLPLRAVALAALAFALSAQASGLQLVGEARLSVLFWSVYDSRLYSDDGSYAPDKRPLRLEIEYLMDIESSALVKQTAQEWRHLDLEHERQQAWLRELAALWPDVSKHDTLTLEVDKRNRSTFFLNGERLGVMEDDDFGEQFLAIWLSPDTSRPKLRQQLLFSRGQ